MAVFGMLKFAASGYLGSVITERLHIHTYIYGYHPVAPTEIMSFLRETVKVVLEFNHTKPNQPRRFKSKMNGKLLDNDPVFI